MTDWLLGTEHLDFNDPGVVFGFARQLPSWAWALIALVVCVLAWMSYAKLEGKRPVRAMLAISRMLALFVLLIMLAGPQLERPNERIERDWVVLLADRSASMTIADAPGGKSRESQLLTALEAASEPIAKLAESRRVLTLEWFDGVALEPEPLAAAGHDLPDIATRLIRTFLRHALRDGYFHADMHQGNIRVGADGTLMMMDFGIALSQASAAIYAKNIDSRQQGSYGVAGLLLGMLPGMDAVIANSVGPVSHGVFQEWYNRPDMKGSFSMDDAYDMLISTFAFHFGGKLRQ